MTDQTPPTDRPLTAGDYESLADLHTIKGWLHGLATNPDLNDVVADGGVTVGDCYQQEAREFAGRIGRVIEHAARPATSAASEGSVNSPDMPGAYEGDVFFGDPKNTTKATHRWSGGQWTSLEASPPVSERERELEAMLVEVRAAIPARSARSHFFELAQKIDKALTAQPAGEGK